MHVEELKDTKGFLYLASPYSRYPYGMEAAYATVSEIAARVIEFKVPVFSPIAHSHGIAMHGEIDPSSHDIWLPVCQPMIDAAAGMIIAEMEGWSDSVGIRFEIEEFAKAKKPIWRMSPDFFLVWPHT